MRNITHVVQAGTSFVVAFTLLKNAYALLNETTSPPPKTTWTITKTSRVSRQPGEVSRNEKLQRGRNMNQFVIVTLTHRSNLAHGLSTDSNKFLWGGAILTLTRRHHLILGQKTRNRQAPIPLE